MFVAMAALDRDPLHYLPLGTTMVAVWLGVRVLRRWRARGRPLHLLWWGSGMLTFAAGTALESIITLCGNSVALTKAWYIAGALLGAYPLAQGTVHLLLSRPLARRLTQVTLAVLTVLVALVLLSPVVPAKLEPHRPGGGVLAWQWVRLLTPLLNGYAAVCLVGGAVWSVFAWRRVEAGGRRAAGNVLIALGALLPAIGGGLAKGGLVEALYVGEFLGMLLIGAGYRVCLLPAAAVQSG
jgi:hypothetical protein